MKKLISLFLVTVLLLACLPLGSAAKAKTGSLLLQAGKELEFHTASQELAEQALRKARLPQRSGGTAMIVPAVDMDGQTLLLGEVAYLTFGILNTTDSTVRFGIEIYKGSSSSDIKESNFKDSWFSYINPGTVGNIGYQFNTYEGFAAGSYLALCYLYSGNTIIDGTAYLGKFKLVKTAIPLKSISFADANTDKTLPSWVDLPLGGDGLTFYTKYNPSNATGPRPGGFTITNGGFFEQYFAGMVYLEPYMPCTAKVEECVGAGPGGVTGFFTVNVTGSIQLVANRSFLSLKPGAQQEVWATVYPEVTRDAAYLHWESRDPKVATVQGSYTDRWVGLITAVAPGNTVVDASFVVGDVTYTASIKVSVPEEGDPCADFQDVERDSWYHGAVDFTLEQGLMGTTDLNVKTYEPYTKVSRAMVASILYRMAGSPEGVEYSGAFTDVPKDQWYATAVEWCAQNALASGKGNGIFDPNGDVTRQELAVFMKKMSDYLNWKLTDTVELTDFPDSGTVQSWAEPYLQWAVAAKLITGKGQENGTVLLAPEATAMRCELASILQRFLALEPEVVEPPATEGDFSQRLIGFLDEAGYKEQSYAVSPLSLRAALALAASGATGETKEQLLKAMGFSSQEELEAWYQTVLANEKAFEDYFNSPEIEDRGDAAYRVVNSAWRNEAAEGDYLEDYLHLIQTTFGADAFSAPAAGLADKINAWVKEQTEGMIPQIVGDGVENMAAVLVNALYLKAGWDGEFAETEPLDFTCADGSTVKKDAIQTTDNLSYYADETTRMAVIPLRGGIRMAVVLGEGGDLGELLAAVEYKKVRLTMPKLDLETGFEKGELCDFLKVQGCEKIFTPEAELDAMFTTALYLSDIVQKVKVKTDEKGLEAAAATAAIFAESAAPDPEDPIDLTLDKTFTFYVFNGATAAPEILFFGRVAD